MNAPDDMLTIPEFAQRLRMSERWVRARLALLPGVVRFSRKAVRVHWPTFVARAAATPAAAGARSRALFAVPRLPQPAGARRASISTQPPKPNSE